MGTVFVPIKEWLLQATMIQSMILLALVLLLWLPGYDCFGASRLRIPRNGLSKSSRSSLSMSSAYRTTSKGSQHSLTFEVAGKEMSFETGRIGRQASGSVVVKMKDTMVYTTVCAEREATPVDFTPLRVDFFARYSAVGQTVGAFHRRDSRGDDNEILVARLIDRPIRPMIKEGWQHETQILSWVLSYDKKQSPDPLAICSSSAAMMVSEVPMVKPVAGVEVGLVDGTVIINPTKEEMGNSTLQMTLAGTKDGILMIEGVADFLPEETMIAALQEGHTAIGVICDAIEEFAKLSAGTCKPKKLDTLRISPGNLINDMDAKFGDDMQQALSIGDKQKRGKACAEVETRIKAHYALPAQTRSSSGGLLEGVNNNNNNNNANKKDDSDAAAVADSAHDDDDAASSPVVPVDSAADQVLEEDEASELYSSSNFANSDDGATTTTSVDPLDVKIAVKKLLVRRMRHMILTTGRRSDGRGTEDVRPIDIDTSLLPGAHGSALFTRGETQSLATATLGSKAMEQRVETLDAMGTKRFYLQYRFPPSSVGEVGRVGGVNRREVGHGNLAERALLACMPDEKGFPYTVRAESLITESCGSSSMATVCGCCLAMLDAGVPLKHSVAGVAMGLIMGEKEGDDPVVLTDILGLEDALGTMDFKVAGNVAGISTFQLDIKSEGLSMDILSQALQQAKRGRLSILDSMQAALATPRDMKDTVPKIMAMAVPPESLGKIIGPKGKTVQTLIETHSLVNINLADDGTVQIEGYIQKDIDECRDAIMKMVEEGKNSGSGGRGGGKEKEKKELGPPPEAGIVYRDCIIKGVHNFGCFVEVLPGYVSVCSLSMRLSCRCYFYFIIAYMT
jgi:polyribonucleotide nucleotidyltransferase